VVVIHSPTHCHYRAAGIYAMCMYSLLTPPYYSSGPPRCCSLAALLLAYAISWLMAAGTDNHYLLSTCCSIIYIHTSPPIIYIRTSPMVLRSLQCPQHNVSISFSNSSLTCIRLEPALYMITAANKFCFAEKPAISM